MKLTKDSSLHFVSLRMTSNCGFEYGVFGGGAAKHTILERREESYAIDQTLLI